MGFVHDGHRWMFVHVPKSGGYAVVMWALPHLIPGALFAMEGEPFAETLREYGIEKHSPARDYRAWMEGTGRDWDAYESFAVLRDPLTRAQSVFAELKNRQPSAYWGRVDPDYWVYLDSLPDADAFVLSGMYDPAGPFNITQTQRWFVSDDDGIIVKHLFPMKTMRDDIPAMLGVPGPIPDWHVGTYDRRLLSPEAEAIVREKYAEDFDLVREVSHDQPVLDG